MAGSNAGAGLDDWSKWLGVVSALIAVGVLPRAWQKSVAAVATVVWVAQLLEQ